MNSIESFSGTYRFLSNFYPSPFQHYNVRYKSVEHFYQSQKTLIPSERQKIIDTVNPGMLKNLEEKLYYVIIGILLKMIPCMSEFLKNSYKTPNYEID